MPPKQDSLYRTTKKRIVQKLQRLWTTLTLMLLSLPCYAADPISNLLTKAVDLLTNKWAVGSAVVAIAVMGYRMKYGMIDKRRALATIVGIVVVFGAALLVDEIRSA